MLTFLLHRNFEKHKIAILVSVRSLGEFKILVHYLISRIFKNTS